MPDYSDEEIDKVSDDVSESDEVLIDGKPVNKNKLKSTSDTENVSLLVAFEVAVFVTKFKSPALFQNGDNSYLRQRNGGKHGHDNPAFIDDTAVGNKTNRKSKHLFLWATDSIHEDLTGHSCFFFIQDPRSKSEDRVLDDQNVNDLYSQQNQHEFKIQAKARNRRSRRLQKKNSLDVQFRRRFSMLRDGNAAANNIYNTSGLFNTGELDAAANVNSNGIANGPGRESRTSSMMPTIGPRASSGNLSTKILDKRFNKMLFNMHGIPVRPNVTNQQQQQGQNQPEQHVMQETTQQTNETVNQASNGHHRHKGRRKHKSSNVLEQNV